MCQELVPRMSIVLLENAKRKEIKSSYAKLKLHKMLRKIKLLPRQSAMLNMTLVHRRLNDVYSSPTQFSDRIRRYSSEILCNSRVPAKFTQLWICFRIFWVCCSLMCFMSSFLMIRRFSFQHDSRMLINSSNPSFGFCWMLFNIGSERPSSWMDCFYLIETSSYSRS
jgi:hypothetical protein